ncbi:MAG: bifunctional folylpolyglutamate synthase/dihydrofolate synthase [Dehalococcoidia bacterium]|nr:MAG: bifunctional folylpolyglutamate synthase/dihydrofolate synthase [Dehalococcoidia bacterium]
MDKYQSVLDFLYSFVDYETSHQPRSPLNYDLRRMDELLARLGNPHLKARTVHIAGTKGKGSTAAMVASVLTASGYHAGLYTSPHLVDIRERMRVDGRLISRSEFVKLAGRLKPEVEAVNARASYGRLTTFELLTALGFMYFADKRVDFQVVEVGLGGRLDATNVVKPEVCAITTLGLDHTDVLGDTLAKIATEKAGIIKPGVPVVSARQEAEAAEVIEEFCRRNDARRILVGRDIAYSSRGEEDGVQSLEIKGRLGTYEAALPLRGRFQQENAAVAVGVLEVLAERGFSVTQKSIVKGLQKVRWPGRFQVIRRRPAVVIDGAHNPQAARELRLAIEAFLAGRAPGRRILVIGMSSDKDCQTVASELAPLFDTVIVTRSRHPRALAVDILSSEFIKYGCDVETADSVAAAMRRAVELAKNNGFACATGSLFIVGEALEWADKPGY